MRLPRLRLTVRGVMALVAGLALLIGGSLEFLRLKRLGHEYAARAIIARRRSAYAKRSAGWSQERWLAHRREVEESNRKYAPFHMGWPPPPEVARQQIAYWGSIISKYERAARYPWLPVAPDPPEPK